MKAGDTVVVNRNNVLMLDRSDGWFIGKRCTIIQKNKSGLYMVHLEGDPKITNSFAKSNLDLIVEETINNTESQINNC